VEGIGGMILAGKKTEVLGEKSVPLPVCLPQILRGLAKRWFLHYAFMLIVKF
jgi:hypothetical protein